MDKGFKEKNSLLSGFTLVETMIAIGLFTIVVFIGITAVLNVNTTYNKTSNQREVIDNLNFIMEDMARNLRLGTTYHCIKTGISEGITTVQDCNPDDGANSRTPAVGIGFEGYKGNPANPGDQQAYFLATETRNGQTVYTLKKTLDNGATSITMTPSSITLDPLKSGFYVINSAKGDGFQPKVVMQLYGRIIGKGFDTPFSAQTTVSQRLLDI